MDRQSLDTGICIHLYIYRSCTTAKRLIIKIQRVKKITHRLRVYYAHHIVYRIIPHWSSCFHYVKVTEQVRLQTNLVSPAAMLPQNRP